jgi:hypothetical protein
MKTQHDEYDEELQEQSDDEELQEQLDNIEVEWSGPGLYWFVGPGNDNEIELGTCYDEEDVRLTAILWVKNDADEDWTCWRAVRDWHDDAIDDLEINFDGPGEYVLEDPYCNGECLGWCDTDADLRSELRRVAEEHSYLVNRGRPNARFKLEDWTGWTVYRMDK